MTRLEALLQDREEPIRFPDDVATLKSKIPELANLADGVVQRLYFNWSEDFWCAGWLILDDATLEEFATYLRQDSNAPLSDIVPL